MLSQTSLLQRAGRIQSARPPCTLQLQSIAHTACISKALCAPTWRVQRSTSCSTTAENSTQHSKQRVQPCTALAGAAGGHHASEDEKFSKYLKLARIHNFIPSIALVVVGAWAGTGHKLAAMKSISVWLMGIISGGIAVASVVVNDYFDLKVDATNAPDKPLPSGAIAPDAALLLSSLLYCACLIAACLMEPTRLRSIVAFSAAATLLYTPLFKKVTAVKNVTVAVVIALAPLAGALAAGAGDAGLLRLLPATLFAFSSIMYREILMDMNDAEGDRAAGVWTLPVMLGKPAALVVALSSVLVGSGIALYRLVTSTSTLQELVANTDWYWLQQGLQGIGLTSYPASLNVLTVIGPVLALLMTSGRLLKLGYEVWCSKYSSDTVDRVVMECLTPVGWGIILLAAMG
eukprot:GHRR01001743.1.p1 GENE.GHRR01001743.1~~GHRR01001743.1.p1  ORF type:complete len:404 (+),score=95.94 GHRR01001743.1:144-1355(+)